MSSPRALTAPSDDVVVVGHHFAEQALAASRISERKRVILPFHKDHADPLHRMFNAVQPGTYVRPHRHASTPRAEVFLVLRGEIDVIVFHDDGRVRFNRRLKAGSEDFGIDLAPGLFHTFLVRAWDTLLYEVKSGPYVESSAKDFASWAPEEGTPDVERYVRELETQLF